MVELAVMVADAWQGQGVGALLVGELLSGARARGVREVRAITIVGNVGIERLLRGKGFRVTSTSQGQRAWTRQLT